MLFRSLIIPPSNILIVYSLASGGVSIAALFVAGYVPGLLLGLSLMVVAALLAPPGAGDVSDAPLDYRLRNKIRQHKAEVDRLEKRLQDLEVEANLAGVPEDWRE